MKLFGGHFQVPSDLTLTTAVAHADALRRLTVAVTHEAPLKTFTVAPVGVGVPLQVKLAALFAGRVYATPVNLKFALLLLGRV